MKNFEVLALISMMLTDGRGIKVNVGGREFRLQRHKGGYDMWHDETTNRLTLVLDDRSYHLLDSEWGEEHCTDLDMTQCRFSFNKM